MVDLVSHLGIMASKCELEAAMYSPLDWYAKFLTKLARSYRDSQYNLLDIRPEKDGLPYLAMRVRR